MRSRTRHAAAAAAAALLASGLAGCGDYSTEDLRFLAALPMRDDLAVEVPAAGAANQKGVATSALCAGGIADTWVRAKPTSDRLNALVDFLAGLVDVVRRVPPSSREADARGWGPFDDDKHPGKEIRVTLTRFYPDPGGAPEHAYAFEARVKGTGAWTAVLDGTFRGASAAQGAGTLALHFDALQALGMADPGSPSGTLRAGYDRTAEPRIVQLDVAQEASGLVGFSYGFQGYADGSGRFLYAFRDQAGNRAEVSAGFDALGRGRATTTWFPAGGGSGSFEQCWSAAACLTYVADPLNLSCAVAPCSLGFAAFCAPVPPAL